LATSTSRLAELAGAVRGRRLVLTVIAASVAIAGVSLVASRSSLFHLRHLEVVGTTSLTRAEVARLAALSSSTNVLWLDPGAVERRLPGNLNLSFGGVEGEALLVSMKDVAVSSGSACTSASLAPSHVLTAIGVPAELAHASIRFGVGRWTTEEEVDYAAETAASAVSRLREGSPLARA